MAELDQVREAGPRRDAVAALDVSVVTAAGNGLRRSSVTRDRSARYETAAGDGTEDQPEQRIASAGAAAEPRRRSDRTRVTAARKSRARGGESAERGEPIEPPDPDPEAVARAICLRLLTVRARTRRELAQALRRKGVPDEAAGAALERLDDVGLIDDGAFAEQWVRSRHTVRGLGSRALAVELQRKGVADDVAGEALAGVDAEAEDRRARELVDRKLRTIPSDTDEQRVTAARRLVGMLARKGYSGGTAYRVVREALAARGAELDELPDAD
ncbi:MAG: regulatory protein RecX [Pseudonocardia sp.]